MGGDGLAFPASTCNLMSAITFFAIFTYFLLTRKNRSPARRPYGSERTEIKSNHENPEDHVVKIKERFYDVFVCFVPFVVTQTIFIKFQEILNLQFLYLDKIEFHRSGSAENTDQYFDFTLFMVDFFHCAVEIRKRAVDNTDFITGFEKILGLWF